MVEYVFLPLKERIDSEVTIPAVAWIALLQVKSKTSVSMCQLIQFDLEG